MADQRSLRPVTTIRLLCEAAEDTGVSTAACLKGTGLSKADILSDHLQVSVAQEILAIENVARETDRCAGLGVSVGRKMHSNAFGIWGFAILTSPTLRTAIESAIEYAALSFVIADPTLTAADDAAWLAFDMETLPAATHRYLLERHAYVTMMFFAELLQTQNVADFRIETADPDPVYAHDLSALLGLDVAAGAACNAFVFPAALLDRPLPKSDPVSRRFCLDQCDALMARVNAQSAPWSQRVRDAVIDGLGDDPKIDAVAKKLAVTERTLRRRLTAEGTSFRALYTDMRLAIARELLETAGLNVETVSWRVGYAEPASFIRAFSRQFGETPGEVRRSNRVLKKADDAGRAKFSESSRQNF